MPNISITIRRLHDTANSGNIYLLNLIPYVEAIVVLIVCTVRSSSTGVRFDRLRPGQTSVLPPRDLSDPRRRALSGRRSRSRRSPTTNPVFAAD